MNGLIPRTASVSDLQRRYRQLIESVEKTQEPILLLRNNRGVAAIIPPDGLEELLTLKALISLEKTKKSGKLVTVHSVSNLFRMVANENKNPAFRKKIRQNFGKTFPRRAKKS